MKSDLYINLLEADTMDNEILPSEHPSFLDQVIIFGSDTLGEGSEDLGEILIRGYIYSLAECRPYPKALLFINSAVKLTISGSNVLSSIRKMESQGVQILSCGTSLDFYNIKDQLCVGGVTNMYDIVQIINSAKNTIRL